MKKTVYQENVEAEIKRQIKWANIDTRLGKIVFLDLIIEFCQKEQEKPFKPLKSSKTKHG